MKGIQIQLKYKNKNGETFSDKNQAFLYNISEKIMAIHVKMLKFEDFYGNFHRYNGRHSTEIII